MSTVRFPYITRPDTDTTCPKRQSNQFLVKTSNSVDTTIGVGDASIFKIYLYNIQAF